MALFGTPLKNAWAAATETARQKAAQLVEGTKYVAGKAVEATHTAVTAAAKAAGQATDAAITAGKHAADAGKAVASATGKAALAAATATRDAATAAAHAATEAGREAVETAEQAAIQAAHATANAAHAAADATERAAVAAAHAATETARKAAVTAKQAAADAARHAVAAGRATTKAVADTAHAAAQQARAAADWAGRVATEAAQQTVRAASKAVTAAVDGLYKLATKKVGPPVCMECLQKQNLVDRTNALKRLADCARTNTAGLSPDQQKRLKTAADRLEQDAAALLPAYASSDVYDRYKPTAKEIAPPAGLRELTPDELAKLGLSNLDLVPPTEDAPLVRGQRPTFRAAAYYTSDQPPKLVIAFRGTEPLMEWPMDVAQALQLDAMRKWYTDYYYGHARVVVGKVIDNLAAASERGQAVPEVILTGHSLGGGLAASANDLAQKTAMGAVKVTTYTYNAAAVHLGTVGSEVTGQGIHAIHVEGEAITSLQQGALANALRRANLISLPPAQGEQRAIAYSAASGRAVRDVLVSGPLPAIAYSGMKHRQGWLLESLEVEIESDREAIRSLTGNRCQ